MYSKSNVSRWMFSGAMALVLGLAAGCQKAHPPCSTSQASFKTDLVIACQSTGEIVPLQLGTYALGNRVQIGHGPQSLARMDDTLLVLDTLDSALGEVSFPDLCVDPESVRTGDGPMQVKVDGALAYVAGSGGNALDVVQGALTESADGGLPLALSGALSTGASTNPRRFDKLGNDLYVALYGGDPGPGAAAGQKVVRVDVSDPSHPVVGEQFDLSTLDLHAFDGGTNDARPSDIVVRNGALYLALNNLDSSYSPNGPGMLARIDLASRQVTAIDLGSDVCLNAGFLAQVGEDLAVVCSGQASYSPSYQLQSIDKAGVVLLNAQDQRISTWSSACPGDSDGGCPLVQPGAIASSGNRLFVGDQNGGRLFVLDVVDGQLVEERGFHADGGAAGPIPACPISAAGYGNVADILVVH